MKVTVLFHILLVGLFLSSFAYGEKTKKIDLDYIYKKDELNIPPVDPDLPKDFQWSNKGHLLAYMVSFATEAPSLTVYNPARDATMALVTPNTLYIALQELENGSKETRIPKTLTASLILNNTANVSKIERYSWSEQANTLLIDSDGKRYKFDPTTMDIMESPVPKEPKLPGGKKQNMTGSPNERYKAYIRGNDLWVYDIEEEKEIRLTESGSESILNARLTWVYWEELYHRQGYRGYSWSPDSSKIAYMQFDETGVSTYPVTDFSTPIPTTRDMFYPKAGTKNPTVRVGIVSLSTRHTEWIDLGAPFEYIARFGWSPNGDLLFVQTLNRPQNELTLHFADPVTGSSRVVLKETDEAWVNVNGGPFFLENSDDFLWLSERSGFRHLYRYDRNGKQKKQLTDGDWEVIYDHWREDENFVFDEERQRVFIKSTKESPVEQHLYSVSMNTGRMKQMTKGKGQHTLEFSPDMKYAINRLRSANVPQRIQVIKDSGNAIRVLGETTYEDYHPYEMQVPELLEIKDDEGNLFYAKMTKPLDFDPGKKYPVVVYVYGGPHAQIVHDAPASTRDMMFVNEGYILFSLDNRGSKGRGHEWEKEIYKRFGTVELDDQLTGIEYLKTLPYVDPHRIGIWGWSYGGYMTCIAMLKAPDVFRAGASVAPVTDYRLYDTIYTERYMSTLQTNPDGYAEASAVNYARQLEGALLLAHGISDDNVHVQNIYHLVDKFIEVDKQYELYLFPEKAHGIGGNDDQYFLFKRILKHLSIHLKGE